jgi:hypothetical protein
MPHDMMAADRLRNTQDLGNAMLAVLDSVQRLERAAVKAGRPIDTNPMRVGVREVWRQLD